MIYLLKADFWVSGSWDGFFSWAFWVRPTRFPAAPFRHGARVFPLGAWFRPAVQEMRSEPVFVLRCGRFWRHRRIAGFFGAAKILWNVFWRREPPRAVMTFLWYPKSPLCPEGLRPADFHRV
jgi:hypothetical protein